MKPSDRKPTPTATIECPCGWSRKANPGENAQNALRYHRIVVHNDQEAVRAHTVY